VARPAALAALPDPESRPFQSGSAQISTQHEMQGAVEGVMVDRQVELLGQSYRIADKIGLMPLLRFAHAAKKGMDADDMEGLAAVYDMLRDCIDPSDWDRFERDATASKAEAEDLLGVVTQAIQVLTARPTSRPSDSSAGPSTTSASSTGSSSSPDTPDGVELVAVSELVRRASS